MLSQHGYIFFSLTPLALRYSIIFTPFLMLTTLPTRLKRTSRWLPVVLLSFATQAQTLNYAPANAANVAGTYTDLAATGTAIATSSTDDANSAAQNIGFTFEYNGKAFTQFVLNTNGFIKLGATPPSAANMFLPESATAPEEDPIGSGNPADVNILAPFNFDLTAGSATGGTEYRVATTGAAPNRVCTIQWKNVADKKLVKGLQYGTMNFQVKLYETTGNIEFVYGPAIKGPNTDDFRYAVVGLKGSGNGSGEILLSERPASSAPWSSNTFISTYYTNAAHNFRGTVPPDAGRTYRFVSAPPPPPPVNDDPTGAIALTLGTTCTPVNATNEGATTTTPAGYANPGCGVAVSPKDVWYKFTTAASGVGSTYVRLQVTGAPAGQVRVFSAASNAGPFTEVGCSSSGDNNTVAADLGLSPLTPNTTYYVFVSGYGSGDATGAFTICATGLAALPAPTYATLPYSESFEGPWIDFLSTRDAPTASWRNTPATSDASWRREDDGAAAAWNVPDLGDYPATGTTGLHSARFHTFGAADGSQGKLDLYVNLSGTGSKTLSFDYVNPTGADKLEVFVSTDGGKTFDAKPIRTDTTSAKFATKNVPVSSNSATTVIRFQATSDYGNDDLGIDNLQLRVITATRNEALAATVDLYPNPAHQGFTLRVPAGSLHAASSRLLNALGQVVQTRQLSLPAAGGNATFDVSRLAPGVYSLELKTSTDLVVKRVVVE